MTRSTLAAGALAVPLVLLLVLPVVALGMSTTPAQLARGLQHPEFLAALGVSLQTSLVALVLVVSGGTPLAWWLAGPRSPGRTLVGVVVEGAGLLSAGSRISVAD